MDTPPQTAKSYKVMNAVGWAVALFGMGLYMYGYFVDGSPSYINWTGFLPDWAVEFVPNLEAELGLLISTIGTGPIYYVQYKELNSGPDSSRDDTD